MFFSSELGMVFSVLSLEDRDAPLESEPFIFTIVNSSTILKDVITHCAIRSNEVFVGKNTLKADTEMTDRLLN